MKIDITSTEYETMIEEMKEGKELVKTPWGNAKIDNGCHYWITSRKEEFHKKYVHRLIWEAFYEKEVPEGYDIHHIDENKLNNAIQNLQCVEHGKHVRFHLQGERHPNYKRHARIVKKGFGNGKQEYAIKFNGKHLMWSIDIGKLINRFSKEYPSEILVIPNSLISELRKT